MRQGKPFVSEPILYMENIPSSTTYRSSFKHEIVDKISAQNICRVETDDVNEENKVSHVINLNQGSLRGG